MFVHHLLKFDRFSLKIGGEIIFQSWPLLTPFFNFWIVHCHKMALCHGSGLVMCFSNVHFNTAFYNVNKCLSILAFICIPKKSVKKGKWGKSVKKRGKRGKSVGGSGASDLLDRNQTFHQTCWQRKTFLTSLLHKNKPKVVAECLVSCGNILLCIVQRSKSGKK